MTRTLHRSPLALAILSLLAEAPMHPYRMQRLIRERGKDVVVNVGQRASLYRTIERLTEAGLVAVRGTSRDQGYPERTVYELTAAGHQTMAEWLRDGLARPEREYPELPAVLSFMVLLPPDEVRTQLEKRTETLEAEIRSIVEVLAAADLPRVFVIEDEYRLARLRAERDWVSKLVGELRSGRLTWTEEWLRAMAAGSGESDQG